MHLSDTAEALAIVCLRPCHYHMSANACGATQTSATRQQVRMCPKDSELYNAAVSLGHYRRHCGHAREEVTAYHHNRKNDSQQVDVATDDRCSLHAQKAVGIFVVVRLVSVQLCCLTDMDLTTLPYVFQVQQSCLAQQ